MADSDRRSSARVPRSVTLEAATSAITSSRVEAVERTSTSTGCVTNRAKANGFLSWRLFFSGFYKFTNREKGSISLHNFPLMREIREGNSISSFLRYCHTSISVQLLNGKTLKCSPMSFSSIEKIP